MNIVKVRKAKNQNGILQCVISIPQVVSKHLINVEQVNVKYNEETGIVECIPILED